MSSSVEQQMDTIKDKFNVDQVRSGLDFVVYSNTFSKQFFLLLEEWKKKDQNVEPKDDLSKLDIKFFNECSLAFFTKNKRGDLEYVSSFYPMCKDFKIGKLSILAECIRFLCIQFPESSIKTEYDFEFGYNYLVKWNEENNFFTEEELKPLGIYHNHSGDEESQDFSTEEMATRYISIGSSGTTNVEILFKKLVDFLENKMDGEDGLNIDKLTKFEDIMNKYDGLLPQLENLLASSKECTDEICDECDCEDCVSDREDCSGSDSDDDE